MRCLPAFRAVAVACALAAVPARAQNESPELREIRELKLQVEQQSRQLEAVSRQLEAVSRQLETGSRQSEAGSRQSALQGQPAPAAATATTAQTAAPASGSAAPAKPPEAPKAPPVEAVNKHVVEKGETLTSIARHYSISVADLQKGNKIEDDRKLQIGQTLVIPAPKPSEAAIEKKENP